MKSTITFLTALLGIAFSATSQTEGVTYPYTFTEPSNPVIKHIHTADPDCHVWADGEMWMYTSQHHDPTDIFISSNREILNGEQNTVDHFILL